MVSHHLAKVRVAIVGCTGFVGGTLMDHLPNADGYNSKNIDSIAGKTYDIIMCAGLPAAKWWINQHPEEDIANIFGLQRALAQAECKSRFVLISTIDVHDVTQPAGQDEDNVIGANHAYGKHRLMMEQWVKEQYQGRCRILRLAGLFGVGLKKNVVYDLLNDNMVDNICVNHMFQWYDMSNMFEDVARATCDMDTAGDARVRNLYSEPVRVDEMIQGVFPEYWERLRGNESPSPVVYAIKTATTPSGWLCSKSEILSQIRRFVGAYRKMRAGRGKLLSVSNLAWPLAQEQHALHLLQKYSVGNLEVAPTRYGSWQTDIDAACIRARAAELGLQIYSTQAVFFGLTVNLFEDPVGFEAHMRRVIELTDRLGAKRIVLGSPNNRRVQSSEPAEVYEQSKAAAAKVLQSIGEYAELHFPEVVVCLEPNSKHYGCNFVNSVEEAFDVLAGVPSKNIGINLDTGNAEMEGEDVLEVIGACPAHVKARIKHIQVSMPYLEALRDGSCGHAEEFASRLRALFPAHVMSLEMKEVCPTLLPSCIMSMYSFV